MWTAAQSQWRCQSVIVAAALTTLWSAPFSFATTWYVEASSPDSVGTKGKPFRTISEAAAVGPPGDEVVVKDGVYRERGLPRPTV